MHALTAVLWMAAVAADPANPGVSSVDDSLRIETLKLESPRQAGSTRIRVLRPEGVKAGEQLRVVYVLPVEAGGGQRYGDGLTEIHRKRLHEKHHVLCAAPEFHDLPWYADHPTDPRLAQESYVLKDVLPRIEKDFDVIKERRGRLLLGFSKSGYGAFSLLLRNPETFERAVAWDAPLAMPDRNRFGAAPIYGSDENFEKYRLFPLLEKRSELLSTGQPVRLALTGWANFRDDHVRAHEFLDQHKIAHEYRDEKNAPHDWHSGWVERSMNWLCRPDAP
jgi:hypothetical protein